MKRQLKRLIRMIRCETGRDQAELLLALISVMLASASLAHQIFVP